MRKIFIAALSFNVLLTNINCTKTNTEITRAKVANESIADELSAELAVTPVTYLIPEGEQTCQPNPLVFTTKSKLTFAALFDSSCIYKTVDPANQDDINKLYPTLQLNGRRSR